MRYDLPPYLFLQASALGRLFRPFVERYATRYQANLAVHLKQYGLRYDDLYDPAMDLVGALACLAWQQCWQAKWHGCTHAQQPQQGCAGSRAVLYALLTEGLNCGAGDAVFRLVLHLCQLLAMLCMRCWGGLLCMHGYIPFALGLVHSVQQRIKVSMVSC